MNIETEELKIKICSPVLEVMKKYIQSGFMSLEAGGVLIGKENISNSDLVIKYITEPYECDKRKHNSFKRKDSKHIEVFQRLYNSNEEIYRYIGEWHTHPEAIPNYSRRDFANWKKIIREAPKDIRHYHIIIGYDAFRVWEYTVESKKAKLFKTVLWKDVTL